MSELLTIIAFSLGWFSLGVAIVIAHQQGQLRKSIENDKNYEKDSNVLALLNNYTNIIINLKHIRRLQGIAKVTPDDGSPESEGKIILFNLRISLESIIRKSETFTQILQHNLKYFSKYSSKILNANSLILDYTKDLKEDNLKEHELFQLEHHLTMIIDFLREYEPLTDELSDGIQYYLEFYKKHRDFIIKNSGKPVEKIIHPEY